MDIYVFLDLIILMDLDREIGTTEITEYYSSLRNWLFLTLKELVPLLPGI